MEKDLDIENIIEKMRSLRDKRDLELLEQFMEDTKMDPDYNKKVIQNKVINVKYLGSIDWENDDKKEIYLLLEQKENEDGELVVIERYYTEDGEFLGGNNTSDRYDYLLLNSKYMNNENLLENLQKLDKEGILDLNELEQDRLEEIALALGVKVEDLEKISEIDTKDELDLEKDKQIENSKDEKQVISKKEIEKISAKTEIKTNQKVTDNETMAQLLGVQDKGYKKIEIVYSDKFKENGSSTRFCFVGIKDDGSAEKIDSLEQGYGNTPTKQINAVSRDGSEINQEQVYSMYKIKGRKEMQLAVDIGSMGTVEPSLVRTPMQDNEKAISIPIETKSIKPTTRETRELMNEKRNPRVKEEIERIEKQRELGISDKDIEIKDFDDNEYNAERTEISKEYIEKCIEEIKKYDNRIKEIFTDQEIKNKLDKELNNGRSISEAKEIAQKDLSIDASHFKEERNL